MESTLTLIGGVTGVYWTFLSDGEDYDLVFDAEHPFENSEFHSTRKPFSCLFASHLWKPQLSHQQASS